MQSQVQLYYFVLFFTAVVYFGYTTVLVNTPHDVVWHLVFNVLHIAMHITWQMTKRTDPGTIGLQDKGIYQSQYVQAIDEMCVTASSYAKVHAVSGVYVVLLLTWLPLLLRLRVHAVTGAEPGRRYQLESN